MPGLHQLSRPGDGGRRRRKGAVAGIIVATSLSGCGGFMPDYTANLPTPWQRVAPAEVPAVLPTAPAAAVVAARMRTTGDLYRSYSVVLANPTALPGENRLLLDIQSVPDSLFGALVPPVRPFPVPLYTSETLQKTLDREFPGLPTKVADNARRNRYGDYDYAVALGENATCVLAWQLITDHTRILPERVEALRLEWRMCGTSRDPRTLLQPFDALILRLSETVLEADSSI